MQFYVQHDCPEFEGRIRYVLDFIQNHPLAGGKVSFSFYENWVGEKILFYGPKNARNGSVIWAQIPAQRLIFSKQLPFYRLMANPYLLANFVLYSIEQGDKKAPAPFFSDGIFGFDLIETIFFHLSRQEEHQCPDSQKDMHGRMLPNTQFLVKHGLEKIPVVDHLVFCFLKVLAHVVAPGSNWPLINPTTWRLSFDIDILEKFAGPPPFRSIAKYLLKTPNMPAFNRLLTTYAAVKLGKEPDPYLTFDWLLNPNFPGKQVIYFLVGGTSRFDKPYPKINRLFQDTIDLAKNKGIEIGLHPSYLTANSRERMAGEKQLLEELTGGKVKRSRQHFLHFSFDTTPGILQALGIEEDSSLGFPDRIGFRCGTGFPYFLFDFSSEAPHRLKEAPLVLMDVALLREGKSEPQTVKNLWDNFISENNTLTHLTFNFHNSRFFDAQLEGVDLRSFFETLVHWKIKNLNYL